MTFTTDRGNRERKAAVARATGLCQYCPYHGGENAGRAPRHGARKPRTRTRRGR